MIAALQITVHFATQLALGNRMVGVAPQVDSLARCLIDGHLPATGIRAIVRTGAGDNRQIRVVFVQRKFRHGYSFPFHGRRPDQINTKV